jgi:hypothetical protein
MQQIYPCDQQELREITRLRNTALGSERRLLQFLQERHKLTIKFGQ